MVTKKYKCEMCGKRYRKNNLVRVNGYGVLCSKCRHKTEPYKISYSIPTKATLLTYFGIKNKNMGEKTKD